MDENPNLCGSNSCEKKKKNIIIPIVASIGGLLILSLIVVAVLWWFKKKPKEKNKGKKIYIQEAYLFKQRIHYSSHMYL